MKKLIFMSMIMQGLTGPFYKPTEDSKIAKNKKFYFPISVKLTEILDKDDDVTLCILKMVDSKNHNSCNNYAANLQALKNEVNEIANLAGANITYKEIETEFSETKDAFGKRFMEMFDTLEENCTVCADITFGTKPTSLLIMNLLHFAEKFYDADIDSIIYGRTQYKNGEVDKDTAKVCDVTILYHLENLTSVLSLPDGESAKKTLQKFFEL